MFELYIYVYLSLLKINQLFRDKQGVLEKIEQVINTYVKGDWGEIDIVSSKVFNFF